MFKATSDRILKHIVDYFIKIGIPQCLWGNNASQFKSKKFVQIIESYGIKWRHISLFHANSNLVERYVKSLKQILRTYCLENHQSWDTLVMYVENQINMTKNQFTGEIPYYVMFGKELRWEERRLISFSGGDYSIDVDKMHDKIRQRVNRITKDKIEKHLAKRLPIKDFQIGQKVLVRSHYLRSKVDIINKKLMLLCIGPNEKIAKVGFNAHKLLVDKNRTVIYNASMLKEYHERITKFMSFPKQWF